MNLPFHFHFLRPGWLLAAIPAAVLFGVLRRRQERGRTWRGLIADHLLPHLLSEPQGKGRIGPIVLLALGWIVSIVALAGPTWRQEPSPFAEDTAALVIVVKVTPSMKTADVQPDRLTRSVQKIHDLLSLRRGAKTGLVAYAGSAHVVMPITTDQDIIDGFAQALDPAIMPKEGDAAAEALRAADKVLAEGDVPGSILWIADGIAPGEQAALARWRQSSRTPVRILAPLAAGPELLSLKAASATAGIDVLRLTPDDADVAKAAWASRFSSAPPEGKGQRREESGYWLTPVLAALMLPFFRRGWLVPTSATT